MILRLDGLVDVIDRKDLRQARILLERDPDMLRLRADCVVDVWNVARDDSDQVGSQLRLRPLDRFNVRSQYHGATAVSRKDQSVDQIAGIGTVQHVAYAGDAALAGDDVIAFAASGEVHRKAKDEDSV